MIECTCAREKILTICDSKKINILNLESWVLDYLGNLVLEYFGISEHGYLGT